MKKNTVPYTTDKIIITKVNTGGNSMKKYIVALVMAPSGVVAETHYDTKAEALKYFDKAMGDTLGGDRLSLYSPEGSIISRYEPVYRPGGDKENQGGYMK